MEKLTGYYYTKKGGYVLQTGGRLSTKKYSVSKKVYDKAVKIGRFDIKDTKGRIW